MKFLSEIERHDFLAAACKIDDIVVRPAGEILNQRLGELNRELEEGRAGGDDHRRKAVRDILRNGRYRPSGRGKPAQEYLKRIWTNNGTIDLINNAVDVNNIFSLRHGLPVSAFDTGKIRGDLVIRLGREGESYVFNATGQVLECKDLVVVCDDRGPIGSPVKDSQETKLFPGASGVVFVVYCSRETMSEPDFLAATSELGDMMSEDCEDAVAEQPILFSIRAPRPT